MKSGSNGQVNKDGKMTITAKDWAENYNSRLEELRLQKCKGYYKLEPNEEWYETGHGCVARDKRKEKSK